MADAQIVAAATPPIIGARYRLRIARARAMAPFAQMDQARRQAHQAHQNHRAHHLSVMAKLLSNAMVLSRRMATALWARMVL